MMSLVGDGASDFDITRDATERSERLAVVGEYALGIAHDFTNVLTVVIANASILGMQYTSAMQMPDELRDIIASAQRGNEMIQRLIRFVRQEPLSIPLLPVDSTLEALPRQIRALLPPKMTLDVDCPPMPYLVRAEVSQIEEIVLNLATNARDSMMDVGTIQLKVSVAEQMFRPETDEELRERTGAFMTIAITDTGCGLDDATRRQMFEPFFTTKRGSKGLGLGLAMTRSLVRQLNGHIEVRTVPGQGTTVSVVLPVVKDSTQQS